MPIPLFVAAIAGASGGGQMVNLNFGNLASDDTSTVSATLLVDSDGGVRKTQESAGSPSTTDATGWHRAEPYANAGVNKEVRVSYSSGNNDYSSGSGLATWLALTSNRSWLFSYGGGVAVRTGTFTLEIRNATTLSVIDSESFTVTLERQTP